MAELNNRLSRVSDSITHQKIFNSDENPQSVSRAGAKVRVNVTIHDKSLVGRKLGVTSGTLFSIHSNWMLTRYHFLVEEETTMRLPALRWNITSVLEQEEMKRARTAASTFFKQTEDGWVKIAASHPTLEEIAAGESEVTLKLVIA